MKKQWDYEQKAVFVVFVLWFAAGLVAGVLLANAGFFQNQEDAKLWGIYTLENIKGVSRKGSRYFYFLLVRRYCVYLAILLSACTPFAKRMVVCFLLLSGFSFGFLSGTVVLLGGMHGIAAMWAAMLPYALCYIPAQLTLLFRVYCMNGMLFRKSRKEVRTFFLVSLGGIVLLFIGISMECGIVPALWNLFH